jgi:hypothetical protein
MSSAILNKLGIKACLFFGSLGVTSFVAANILPAYKSDYPDRDSWLQNDKVIVSLLYMTSVFVGCGASLVWVCNGDYISECATSKTKGTFFGLFWGIFMSSEVFGNLTAALILKYGVN